MALSSDTRGCTCTETMPSWVVPHRWLRSVSILRKNLFLENMHPSGAAFGLRIPWRTRQAFLRLHSGLGCWCPIFLYPLLHSVTLVSQTDSSASLPWLLLHFSLRGIFLLSSCNLTPLCPFLQSRSCILTSSPFSFQSSPPLLQKRKSTVFGRVGRGL